MKCALMKRQARLVYWLAKKYMRGIVLSHERPIVASLETKGGNVSILLKLTAALAAGVLISGIAPVEKKFVQGRGDLFSRPVGHNGPATVERSDGWSFVTKGDPDVPVSPPADGGRAYAQF